MPKKSECFMPDCPVKGFSPLRFHATHSKLEKIELFFILLGLLRTFQSANQWMRTILWGLKMVRMFCLGRNFASNFEEKDQELKTKKYFSTFLGRNRSGKGSKKWPIPANVSCHHTLLDGIILSQKWGGHGTKGSHVRMFHAPQPLSKYSIT